MELNENFIVQGAISLKHILKITESAKNKNVGAHTIFIGQVRADSINNKIVKEIEYSAYEEMVTKELKKIISDISTKYGDLQQIVILHSIGTVKAGENSLLVLISAGHRKNVFIALDDIVNQIKKRVPIWKKEILEDASYVWTEN
jgi:molybdopterin synthase catalytic subunit